MRPSDSHASGTVSTQRAPRRQDLGGALDRPEQGARVDLGDRHEPELQRRDRAQVPGAAAEPPEQLRLRVAVRVDERPVGEDHVRRDDAVAGQAVGPDHPADPAAERVAQQPDVGRGAREIREAVLARGRGEGVRERAGLDAGRSGGDVDRDPAHPLGLEQDRVRGPVDGARVVPAGVERDPLPVLGGEAHDRRDVLRGRRVRDGDRPLVDGQVPRLARGVPALVAGKDDLALEPGAELGEVAGRHVPLRRQGGSSRPSGGRRSSRAPARGPSRSGARGRR